MKTILLKSTAVAAAMLVAGCDFQPAGNQLTQNFGAATTTNQLAQSVSSGGLLADLNTRFRSSAPDMINFAFNSAALDAQARQVLDQQAQFIRSNPAIRFRVYGHTDLVGSNAYNQRLGLRRAQAAVNYLTSIGVRRGQVQAVSSFGETRPLVNTQNRERLNRRTVTEVFGLDRRFGTYDFDGKVANNIYTTYSTNSGVTAASIGPGGG